MQVNSGNTVIQMSSTENSQKSARPEGAPPSSGGVPPGLEDAVSTLTDEEQDSTTEMLASLSEEQQDSLKAMLDELEPMTDGLTDEDIGSVFYEALSSIYNSDNTDTTNNSSVSIQVDTYA